MVGANLYESDIEAVSELRTEQSIPSRLRRSSTVIVGKQYWRILRIGRVQSNLKLGGNTDLIVRPKLVIFIDLGFFVLKYDMQVFRKCKDCRKNKLF